MANRYWVGGTGNWSDDDNHWATSSGGTPANGNLPTSLDDVFIDSNSGFGSGGTITLDDEAYLHDLTCSSGHNYTINGIFNFWCYGDAVFESGITYSLTGEFVLSGNESRSITTNGCVLYNFSSSDDDYTGEATLLDDLEISGTFYLANGSFDANDHNVTAGDFYFYADEGYTPTVNMGSGTWEMTGEETQFYIEQYSDQVVTIIPETSTIKFTGGYNELYFYDDTSNETGKIFNNIWVVGADTDTYIYGSNTFNDFKVTNPPENIIFGAGSTQTLTTFTVSGTAGNLVTLDGITAGEILTLELVAGSRGYTVGDELTVEEDSEDATITVDSVKTQALDTDEVTNGGFTGNADGWTLGGGWAYSSNNIASNGGGNANFYQTISDLEYNTWYKVSVTLGRTSGGLYLALCGSGWNVPSSTGTHTNYIFSGSSNKNISVTSNATYVGTVDDIKVEKVLSFEGEIDEYTLTSGGTSYTVGNHSLGGGTGSYGGVNILTVDNEQFNLSKSSGTVECDYLDISNSNATGGATWYAGSHSVDTANNDGWLFDANDKRDARITGKNTANSERSARISGKVVSERNARIMGSITEISNRDAYIKGKASIGSARNARITGKNTSDDNRSARVSGKLASNSERNAKITGIATTTDERDTRITGKSTANSARNVRITGVYIVNSERDARISGIDTLDDEREATIFGVYRDQDERGAKIWGQDVVVSYRAARIRGKRKTPWTKEISSTSSWTKRANPTSIWTKEDNEL
jgi:hypothetical protein